jgi:transposase-like protein
MIGGRGIEVDHSTLHRWIIHYSPLLENEFRKKDKRKIGSRWRRDETYIKIKGVWHFLYRAVDKDGEQWCSIAGDATPGRYKRCQIIGATPRRAILIK